MKGLGLLDESMSNLTSTISNETSISSNNAKNESSSTTNNTMLYAQQVSSSFASQAQAQPPPSKKKRSLPGNPDPEAEVIALSPKSLLATNRFVCEICNKGFQRDQNLQLHRRGHNLPWKLKQRDKDQIIRKKVYVCPVQNCVHHDPSRALGDLTGIKKHFCRKHGEKKWKCEKCSKKYAVQSDWKAHSKICGTREYRCDCGTLFSRRDSFITHRAFCDALAEESARGINPLSATTTHPSVPHQAAFAGTSTAALSHMSSLSRNFTSHHHHLLQSFPMKKEQIDQHASDNMVNIRQDTPPWLACPPPPSQPPQQTSLDHGHHAGPGFSTTSHAQLDHQAQLFTFQTQFDQNETHGAPTLNAGPTLSSFQVPSHPQMSATALLQRAAEMGVTMSNDHQHQHQHHGNNDIDYTNNNNQMSAGLSSISHEGGGGGQQHHHHHQQTLVSNTSGGLAGEGGDNMYNSGGAGQSCSMLHDNVSNMLMNSMQTTASSSMFDSSNNFGDFHNQTTKSQPGGNGGGSDKGGGGGGSDGMTRDFLGLRTFSHKDFLNMAGLRHMNTSSSASFDQQQHQDQHNQTPW